MPVFGDQYNGASTFGENSPHQPTEYTEQDVKEIQDRLGKQLGPEWTESRDGPSRSTVYYIPTHKAIDLANNIFGFNGWSSSIKDVKIDFIDADDKGNLCVGCSVLCRVTLKDGTFHEDIGYGESKSKTGKAAAFEHARKTASSDALKRALRQFGSGMGNCLYDKTYLGDIRRLPRPKIKMDPNSLYRHPSLAFPNDIAPPGQQIVKQEVLKTNQNTTDSIQQGANEDDEFTTAAFDDLAFLTEDDLCMLNASMTFDEFDDRTTTEPQRIMGLDSDSRTSTTTLLTPDSIHKKPLETALVQFERFQNNASRPQSQGPQRSPEKLQRSAQAGGSTANGAMNNGANGSSISIHANSRQNPGPTRGAGDIQQRGQYPPTATSARPNQHPQNQASHQNQSHMSKPVSSNGAAGQIQRNQLNASLSSSKYAPSGPQPTNPGHNSSHHSYPQQGQVLLNQSAGVNPQNPTRTPAIGFYNSRAAEHFAKDNSGAPAPVNLAFDAKAPFKGKGISQSVSHSTSAPVTRQLVGQPAVDSTASKSTGSGTPPAQPNQNRPNFVNPQTDANRRIGMPPTAGQSPMAPNRTMYKPPNPALAAGVKRNADTALERPPLSDVSNGQTTTNNGAGGQEQATKRQRVDAGENGNVKAPGAVQAVVGEKGVLKATGQA